ncbi:MAG: ribosome silencing factor [Clostridia bacterium]|nr:ribosome silencing factor [Clostridia bacterium]
MEEAALAKSIAKILDDKKAYDIVALNVGQLTVITDYMVIASGRNVLQTRALADEVDDKMAEMGVPLRTREGYQEGRWIVLDYGTVLVHIFHPEAREFYHLERLWSDGTNQIDLGLAAEDGE